MGVGSHLDHTHTFERENKATPTCIPIQTNSIKYKVHILKIMRLYYHAILIGSRHLLCLLRKRQERPTHFECNVNSKHIYIIVEARL